MVSRLDSYGIAMRLVAGTRPATTLAASSDDTLAASSAGMPTLLLLLIVMTGLLDFCLLDF